LTRAADPHPVILLPACSAGRHSREAYRGAGALLHFVIAFGIVAVYFAVALPLLTRRPFLGPLRPGRHA
jgi:hypothetical protein